MVNSRAVYIAEEIDEDEDPYEPVEIPSGEAVIAAAKRAIQEILQSKGNPRTSNTVETPPNTDQPTIKN
ncbi:unnamed protein product [Sphagnum jensenii]